LGFLFFGFSIFLSELSFLISFFRMMSLLSYDNL
jgi:hypothetical protein